MVRKRCAIYTRKSSEEGLEQEFNSLHAQRESCEAYIRSQKHEGWEVVKKSYDDGGISGGTMDRPALRQLLADIDHGSIDVVVVYKVDRLTRSLTDFAKIVEVFDQHGVSFVSVTQQFNTTSSMGRLTLNVLLSFAQFEREVTGERIRDKIAASKKKGMWMGGCPPLGYDLHERKLLVSEKEAKTVRFVFQRFAETGSVRKLAQELDLGGMRSKRWTRASGRTQGGCRFSRGAIYKILSNSIYRGQICHKGETYEGRHEAIVEEKLWTQVQERLEVNRVHHRNRTHAKEPSVLAGMIVDGAGRKFTASHAVKGNRRYRYYISQGEKIENRIRIPSGELERAVLEMLKDYRAQQLGLENELAESLEAFHEAVEAGEPSVIGQALRELGVQIAIDSSTLTLRLSNGFETEVPFDLRRCGHGKRLVLSTGMLKANRPDPALLKLLAKAWKWRREMERDPTATLTNIAKAANVAAKYVGRAIRVAYLSPKIMESILNGAQGVGLTREALKGEIPVVWADQEALFGLSERANSGPYRQRATAKSATRDAGQIGPQSAVSGRGI